ncbi:MAG: hypothetical protein PVH19_00015 [Planctomycetia bacterium]|jgi:hypothetical protein
MICRNCNTKFTGKRNDAKFCSTRCRVAYHRKHPIRNTQTVTETKTAAWFDNRPTPANLVDDYAELCHALRDLDREALIQEIVCYRADCEQLRTQNVCLQARLMKHDDLISVTTDVGTPDERVMKSVAPTLP